MVASVATIERVLVILENHLDRRKLRALLDDLSEVDGNSSFIETIKKLRERFETTSELRARYENYLETAGPDPMDYDDWRSSIAIGRLRRDT